MASSNEHSLTGPGALAPELVPVVEPGAKGLPLTEAAGTSGDALALDGLLSDALFGEVIDISDLIPRVMSPAGDAAALSVLGAETVAVPTGLAMADGDILGSAGHAAALTILYDDDILASDGAFL